MLKYYIYFFGLLFPNDNYPFFSDIEKQLEFENKRITIEEINDKEQYLTGGGSRVNPLWFYNKDLPFYYQEAIETKYRYISEFNIVINGLKVSETEFLNYIGLNNDAVTYLTRQLEEYKNNNILKLYTSRYDLVYYFRTKDSKRCFDRSFSWGSITKKSQTKLKNYSNEYRKFLGRNYILYPFLGGSVLSVLVGDTYLDKCDDCIPSFFTGTTITFIAQVFITAIRVWTGYWAESDYIEIIVPFTYKQQLSTNSIKTLAESYNRKIYKEIQTRPL